MHIAIDVNDATVAEKILQFLQNFKNEVVVTQEENSPSYLKQRESLHKIYKETKSSDFEAQELNQEFWDDMDAVIKNA
ncbi:MAG: hypothetical protein AB7U24_07390 [Sulfurimonadaceae bacterium]|jgi:sortase (surface protein transpeptidase)